MTDPAGRDEPWLTLSVKRIVRAGAWAVAFLVVILTGDAAIRFITGAPAVFDVNAWAIVKCLVQVFAAACIAAPVATFVLWGRGERGGDGHWNLALCRAVRRDVPHAPGCALDEATEVARQRFRLTRQLRWRTRDIACGATRFQGRAQWGSTNIMVSVGSHADTNHDIGLRLK